MDELNPELTTIRVGGIPTHVSEAEFNCWFLCAPGFDQATLSMPGFVRMKFCTGDKPIAFILFDSAVSCSEAIQTLTGSGWNCQFAKNSLDQPSKKSFGGEGFLGGVVC